MTPDKLLVLFGGIFGIGFTFWFFLLKNQTAQVVDQDDVNIIVEGGYQPESIVIPHGKKTIINFIRKDANSCLEEVILADFHIRRILPLNKKVTVEINPKQPGEYIYSCGMNMYHGKIIVK